MRCEHFSAPAWMRWSSAAFLWRNSGLLERTVGVCDQPIRRALEVLAAVRKMTQPVVALLGRTDEPTDAVEQFCVHLGAALRGHDFAMEIVRAQWRERGWSTALRDLQQRAAGWRGRWILLQYTALAWSSRGFPLQVPRVIKVLYV